MNKWSVEGYRKAFLPDFAAMKSVAMATEAGTRIMWLHHFPLFAGHDCRMSRDCGSQFPNIVMKRNLSCASCLEALQQAQVVG